MPYPITVRQLFIPLCCFYNTEYKSPCCCVPARLVAQHYICGVVAAPLAMWKTVCKIVLSRYRSDTLQYCEWSQSLLGQKWH